MKMSWAKPPPLVAIGGTETYLRDREVRNAALQSKRAGKSVIWADNDSEAVDALTSADTFGDPSLVIINASQVEEETAKDVQENGTDSCLLLVVDGDVDDSKHSVLSHVHGAYRVEYTRPKYLKERAKLAVRFARAEAARLLGKDALPKPLAEAMVGAVGSDLGVVSFEVEKVSALARSRNESTIDKGMVKALIKPTSTTDMSGVVNALQARDARRLAKELNKIKRLSTSDPVMLLLRSPTGPAMQAHLWLKAAYLKKLPTKDMASRLELSEWVVEKRILPTLKSWKTKELRKLIGKLAAVDRGVFLGSPSPWDSLESALLTSCNRD